MKLRNRGTGPDKVQADMTPMIDVVFQLLIFFMLTLKIVEPEGDFNINMPIGAPSSASPDTPLLPELKVKLAAGAGGVLSQLSLNNRGLGNDAAAFDRLNGEILRVLGNPADPANKDLEVEIDADYNLNYVYTIKAIAACRGKMDPASGQLVSYIEKIKFAPPQKPAGG